MMTPKARQAAKILRDYQQGKIDKKEARRLLGELTDDKDHIEETLSICDGGSDVVEV